MKVKALKPFVGQGGFVEVGDELEVNDSIGADLVAKGYAMPKEEPKAGAGREPLFKVRIGVSKDRSLAVTVWPPSQEGWSPSVVLEEGRKGQDGKWENSRTYLPFGGKLLELSEAIKLAWAESRKHGQESQE